jgi:ABC-type multidrug transport system fused ATPase/permease subunit
MSTIRKTWSLLLPAERRTSFLLLILMLLGAIFETLGVGLIVPIIAVLSSNDLAKSYPALAPILREFGGANSNSLIIEILAVLLIVYVIKTVFVGFLIWRQSKFAYSMQAEMSRRLFQIYLHQPYTFHLQRNTAELIQRTTIEVQMFNVNVVQPLLGLSSETLVFLALLGLLLAVQPLGTLLVSLIVGGAAFAFYSLTHVRLARWGKGRSEHDVKRIQYLQEGLGGAKDIKLFGREAEFIKGYGSHNAQTARYTRYQSTLNQLPRLWLELVLFFALVALVLFLITQGKPTSSVLPMLGLFAAAAFRLMPSLNRMLSSVQQVRSAAFVIDTLHREFQLEIPAQGRTAARARPFGQVVINKVSYTYPGAERPALKSVSLVINAGEAIGIVGPSGAGKSTLVDVLLGLLKPDMGEVLVDGTDVHSNIRSWQDQIGYVPQVIYLTDNTLRANVAFGIPDEEIDDSAVGRAVHDAQLESFIKGLPSGYASDVGERGARLSGGERQRIGIARALYCDPSIVVLDEATSSLDVETERGILDVVRSLHGMKTIVIIAHRMSTVSACDRLYRVTDGHVTIENPPMKTAMSAHS